MQFSALLVTFAAATVSAIDVRGYVGDNCGGAWVGCANLNPNVCCTPFGGSRASVGFAAVSFFRMISFLKDTKKEKNKSKA